jgi:pathogen-inducible salicylic acid glucosyltransferase
MREVASGLLDAGWLFLCVVRALEAHKLPAGYDDACGRHDGCDTPGF